MKKLVWLLWAAPLLAEPTVSYHLSFPNAVHHEAEVTATFSGMTAPLLEVVMSRSSPGRYALHEFAKNVYRFSAQDEAGHALAVSRPNPYGWNVAGYHEAVTVRYTLFGDHADGTYAGIDETHAHLNLPAALVWAHGFENARASLSFDMPPGSDWRVATQLAPQPNGSWAAPNLAWLMDSPVELSAHTMLEWQIESQHFRLALHQRGSLETAKSFAKMCRIVTLEAAGVFGSLPKFDDGTYTFLIDYLPYVYGDGMEHRNSTSISGASDFKSSETQALATVSHEFFHAWNVKRIRPRSLEPFDFERADMSAELWFAEGFTSYYGPLILQRAGFSTFEEFARRLGAAVNRVLTAPGRDTFSAAEMSELAPFVDAATHADATNFPNTFISYYTYGEALGFGIDLAIRQRFPGKSLDDWLRVLWRLHPDSDRPYTLSDLEAALAEATGDASFARAIFARHIEGREPLDYQALLSSAGLQLRKSNPEAPWMGIDHFETSAEGVKLTQPALRGSPLYAAGLEQGDEISQCDNKKIKKPEDVESCLARHLPGQTLKLEYLSRAGHKRALVTLAQDPAVEIVTFEKAGLPVNDKVKSFREAWLGSQALQLRTTEPVVIW